MSESTWRKLTGPTRRRIRLLISRAVGRLVDPATLLQTLQLELLRGEVLGRVEHVEGYGLTAHPPSGFEAVTASLGGDRAHTVCLAAFHRSFRVLNLAEGEVCLYTDEDIGGPHRIHFKRNREIHLIAGVSSIVIKPTGITLTAPLIDMVQV